MSFNSRRRKIPFIVMLAQFNAEYGKKGSSFNLVEIGGRRYLREDVYDSINSGLSHILPGNIQSVYDVSLMGGEPYEIWH